MQYYVHYQGPSEVDHEEDKMGFRNLTINMIKINSVRDELQAKLKYRQAGIHAGTVEEKLNTFKSIEDKLSNENLGMTDRKYEDGFDGNSMEMEELINNRNLPRNNMLSKNTKSAKARYRTFSQPLQKRLSKLKNIYG